MINKSNSFFIKSENVYKDAESAVDDLIKSNFFKI